MNKRVPEKPVTPKQRPDEEVDDFDLCSDFEKEFEEKEYEGSSLTDVPLMTS